MRRRIKECDFEAVFAYGECFRFALRLHDRWGYEIHGIRNDLDPTRWGHVWAVKDDGKGIDIRGINSEKLLVALANAELPAEVKKVDIQEVRNLIEARGYPRDLSTKLDSLADWIVDTHERFNGAKPTAKCLREIFDRDNNR